MLARMRGAGGVESSPRGMQEEGHAGEAAREGAVGEDSMREIRTEGDTLHARAGLGYGSATAVDRKPLAGAMAPEWAVSPLVVAEAADWGVTKR